MGVRSMDRNFRLLLGALVVMRMVSYVYGPDSLPAVSSHRGKDRASAQRRSRESKTYWSHGEGTSNSAGVSTGYGGDGLGGDNPGDHSSGNSGPGSG